MSSQMHRHLRAYADDAIKQKVRLGKMINDYMIQEEKSRERIIDQTNLRTAYMNRGLPQSEIDRVTRRRDQDQEIWERTKKIIEESKEQMHIDTMNLTTHMEELTELEMVAGGFVTHPVGVDYYARFDEDTKTITFQQGGRAEVAIGVRLNKWNDSSQLTMEKVAKK